MGANFDIVVVPKKIQTTLDLQKFYEAYRAELVDAYGEDFEGYSGDLAVDNGELEIREDLVLDLPKYKKALTKNSLNKDYADYNPVEKMMDLVNDHVKKWEASIAIRVNDQWIICGSYSD